jgi:platelet-activating factor acetylhydrolase IB subunit alpha
VRTGAVSLVGHRGPITSVSFHPAYSLLASCAEDGAILIWDTETGSQERSLRGHTAAVNSIAFDPTGKLLASCGSDSLVKLWCVEAW